MNTSADTSSEAAAMDLNRLSRLAIPDQISNSTTSLATLEYTNSNGTEYSSPRNISVQIPKTYRYKEVEEVSPILVDKVTQMKTIKAQIPVPDAFPKIVRLNAKTSADPLPMQELHTNTSSQTSIELQLNR